MRGLYSFSGTIEEILKDLDKLRQKQRVEQLTTAYFASMFKSLSKRSKDLIRVDLSSLSE